MTLEEAIAKIKPLDHNAPTYPVHAIPSPSTRLE